MDTEVEMKRRKTVLHIPATKKELDFIDQHHWACGYVVREMAVYHIKMTDQVLVRLFGVREMKDV